MKTFLFSTRSLKQARARLLSPPSMHDT